MRRTNAVFFAAIVLPGTAFAEVVVLESYAKARPAEAERLVPIILEELDRRGVAVLPHSLRDRIEKAISRSGHGSEDALSEAARLMAAGHADWLEGRLGDATEKLETAIGIYRSAPANVAEGPRLRDELFRARLYLSLAYQRAGDAERASAEMAEIVRGFPDREVSRRQHGPEAEAMYSKIRAELSSSGPGSLEVDVDDPATVVFVNERYAGTGRTTVEGMLPGPYRVYVQKGAERGRVHDVYVAPGKKAELEIDWAFDSALRTSGQWVGFELADETARDSREAAFVSEVARRLDARGAVIIGVRSHQGRSSIIGTVLSLDSTKPVRMGAVAIDPVEPSPEKLRSLAHFLAGGAPAPDLVVEPRAPEVAARLEAPSIDPWPIVTMSAGGAVTVTGVALIAVHVPKSENGKRNPTYRETRPAGIALTVTGVLAAAAGLTWLFLSRDQPTLFVAPAEDGAVAGVAGRF